MRIIRGMAIREWAHNAAKEGYVMRFWGLSFGGPFAIGFMTIHRSNGYASQEETTV